MPIHERVARLYHGIAPIVVGLIVAFTATSMAWPKLAAHAVYPEPIAGDLALSAHDKASDLRAFFLFTMIALGTTMGIAAVFRQLSGVEGAAGVIGKALNGVLLASTIPAAWRLGDAFVAATPPAVPKECLILIGVATMSAWGLRRFSSELTAEMVWRVCGGSVLLAAFGFLAGLGVATATGRVAPSIVERFHLRATPYVALGTAIAVLVAVTAFARAKSADEVHDSVRRGLKWLQFPIALLYFVLIPPPFHREGRVESWPFAITLPLLVVALVGVAWYSVARRRFSAGISDSLAPMALAAVAAFVAVTVHHPPEPLTTDFFHFGEEAIIWQQWRQFGKMPYRDLVPVHGLMALARGAMSSLFYDGSAIGFCGGEPILVGLAGIATFLTLQSVVGRPAALVLSFHVPFVDRFYFLAPAVLVLAHPKLLRHPGWWLLVWLAVCGTMVFYNGGLGPALLLGSAPAATFIAFRVARDKPMRFAVSLASLGLIAAGLLTATPLGAMVNGYFEFLREMGAVNTIASGIPWAESFGATVQRSTWAGSPLLFEALRFGWIGVMIGAIILLIVEVSRPEEQRRPSVVMLAATLPGVLTLTGFWVLNRIDAGIGSRTGALAVVALSTLAPTPFLVRLNPSKATIALLFFAVLNGCFGRLMGNRIGPALPPFPCREVLQARAMPIADPAPGSQWVDGPALGIPNLGKGFAGPAKPLHLITDLRQITREFLRPGETFFDLSNQPALYFYLELPVPIRYPHSFCWPQRRQQARVLQELQSSYPPMVLVSPHLMLPANWHSYHLFRDAVLRYPAVKRASWIVLVDPQRVPDAGPIGSSAQLELLETAFADFNLGRIPANWGRSWESLAGQFEPIITLPPAPSAKLGGLAGTSADFLKLELQLDRVPHGKVPELDVTWIAKPVPATPSADTTPYTSRMRFLAHGNQLVVPLGMSPRWLLSPQIDEIRIEVVNPESLRGFNVKELQLLRLKPAR